MMSDEMSDGFPRRPRAVITGAGSGLGRAFCLELAKQKGRIIAADIDLTSVRETADLVQSAGGQAIAVKCDVSKLSQVKRLGERIIDEWKGVDILINNAGVAVGGDVGEVSIEDWRWIVDINTWGVIYGCHVFVPLMKRRRRGWIINVASTAGIASLPEMAPYNLSKAAVISLSETLSSELSPFKVNVTALCPTYFPTNLMQRFRSASDRQKNISNAFFERASTTAEHVAAAGLQAVLENRLIEIPQADGRQVLKAKSANYEEYFNGLVRQVQSGVFDKLAQAGARSTGKTTRKMRPTSRNPS